MATDEWGRTLHTIRCADCNQESTVPFLPVNGKPVYCKACYSKRRYADKKFDI